MRRRMIRGREDERTTSAKAHFPALRKGRLVFGRVYRHYR